MKNTDTVTGAGAGTKTGREKGRDKDRNSALELKTSDPIYLAY